MSRVRFLTRVLASLLEYRKADWIAPGFNDHNAGRFARFGEGRDRTLDIETMGTLVDSVSMSTGNTKDSMSDVGS